MRSRFGIKIHHCANQSYSALWLVGRAWKKSLHRQWAHFGWSGTLWSLAMVVFLMGFFSLTPLHSLYPMSPSPLPPLPPPNTPLPNIHPSWPWMLLMTLPPLMILAWFIKNLIQVGLFLWRWGKTLPQRYQSHLKDNPDVETWLILQEQKRLHRHLPSAPQSSRSKRL